VTAPERIATRSCLIAATMLTMPNPERPRWYNKHSGPRSTMKNVGPDIAPGLRRGSDPIVVFFQARNNDRRAACGAAPR
jgi:hypothetical protein